MISTLDDVGCRIWEIADILEMSETEVWDYLKDRDDTLREAEDFYNEVELPKIREALRGLVSDIPLVERREMRRQYLLDKIRELRVQPQRNETELRRLLFELKLFLGDVGGVSREMIQQARQYPITRLIKSHALMALCPFHNEKTPSMNIKNNFYYCHGCGATGDVIDFVMKIESLSFNQAVNKLCQI